MGKRSSFKRIPRDLYPTPFKAVVPLIPYLRRDGVHSFAEPCDGGGNLIDHLESFGLTCAYRGDIATGRDALALTVAACRGADAIITNPPYRYETDPPRTRRLMHDLIMHLQRIAPTWLLIDHDWMTNLCAAPYLPHCSDIVVVGRVKWFPDTDNGGKDNYSWYRFDANHRGGTAIHNDRGMRRKSSRPRLRRRLRHD